MDGKVYRIALDLKKNLITNVETLVQNDINSNIFEIEVFNDGEKMRLEETYKVEVAAKKSDGTVVVDQASNYINTVEWKLSQQALTCSGYVIAEVRILSNKDVMTASQSFKFLVRPNNLNDETIKSTSQYRALDEAVKKAEELQKELQGVPEQVASIKAQFDTVKTALKNSQKELAAGLELSNKNIAEIKTYLSTVNEQITKLKEKEVDIANLKALLKNLEDLKTRLANLEATLSDAKTTDSSLKSNITQGNKTNSNLQGSITTATNTQNSLRDKTAAGIDINNKLGQSIKTGQGIVTNINAADKSLADKIATADTSKSNLDKSISTANTAKSNLDKSKAQAESTKIALDMANSEASSNKTALDDSIGKAETAKSNVDASTTQANNTKSALDKSIETGQTVNKTSETNKTNLDKSIQDAKDAKANLDESTGKANTAKSNVDASTATADAKNTELISTTSTATSTDEAAKKTIAQLQALLNQSGTTEQNLKDIIASGNLDKYVTDPKLQEALKDYVTTGNLTTELAKYTKSADLVSQLDSKVDKVAGKILTSNDFTNADKAKLDDLTKITKVSQLTNDSNYITDLKMQEALAKIKTLKKEVADTLPTSGQDDVIYLVKDSKGKDNNVYLEYLWLDKWELIGSTEVDLSRYVTLEEFKNNKDSWYKSVNALEHVVNDKLDKTAISQNYNANESDTVPSSKALSEAFYDMSVNLSGEIEKKVDVVDGKGLSTNDYTNEDKEKLDGIDLSKYVTDEKFGQVDLVANNALSVAKLAENKSSENEAKIQEVDKKATDAIDSVKKVSTRAAANGVEINTIRIKVKEELSKKADKTEIADFKRCIVLTQAEYDALSSTDKNRADTLYFIKA